MPSTTPLPLAEAAQERLRTRRLGRPMEGHAALGSTNARALDWAQDGAPEGSTVVTDHQTGGRGRHGRTWQAQPGQSLTFSVVLRPGANGRPALPARRWGLIALAGGLAVCEALEAVTGAPAPRLKWPNDVLLAGRKCCGVLAETASTGTAGGPLVLGIGLNVGQRDFPSVPDGATPPTSLALAAGGPAPERAPLLAEALRHLERRYRSLFEDDGEAVRAACTERLAARGERVAVQHVPSGERVEGLFRGLAPDGAMRLQTDADQERLLHSGDVTTR